MTDRATLSIVIPIYNERNTWRELLSRVKAVELGDLDKQILLVDDGSTDGTREQLQAFSEESGLGYKVLFHEANRGKGAALRTGFAAAEGDFVIVQDADLEYDPADYPSLIEPLLAGEADVVYGSRFLIKKGRKGRAANYLANRFLTALSNSFTRQKLTDMETCYKVFRRSILAGIDLRQERFGFEPEITAKVSRLGIRICERPISYDARHHSEGKKIGFLDGLEAIWCIIKYGILRR
ncbi:MAG: glycosyltransferase family 2 protein [Planctomycetota bacterium]|jgi:glycosyltransferase involved in cell wall biosynthesis